MTSNPTAEETLNYRDLQKDKVKKTSEKIFSTIQKDDATQYRLVQRYMTDLNKRGEQWEDLHMQYANLKGVHVNDEDMKAEYEEVQDILTNTETAAEEYYLKLKLEKKKRQDEARAKANAEAQAEKERKRKAEAEIKKPQLKSLVINELKEINKLVLVHSKSLNRKVGGKGPDPDLLSKEVKDLENRLNGVLKAYNEFLEIEEDTKEINKLRDQKNAGERQFRAEIVKIETYIAKVDPSQYNKGSLKNPQKMDDYNTKEKRKVMPSILVSNVETGEKTTVKAFPDNVLSVSMDESHILVGLEEGGVVCVLQANNHQRFATENLSESGITAVLCDNFDVKGQSLFYAGDQEGNLFVLGEKGNVIDKLQVTENSIFALKDVEARKVWVYSENERSVVIMNNNKLELQAKKPSKWSMGEDSSIYAKRERGTIGLDEFDCTVPSRVFGTPRINVEQPINKEWMKVMAYGTDGSFYKSLVYDNKVLKRLEVTGRGQAKIRSIQFDYPVKQVFNCFSKMSKVRQDALYVLTTDDKITRFTASQLTDSSVPDHSLDRVVVYDDNKAIEGDLGDIEQFTVRNGAVMFCIINSTELFLVKDDL